MIKYILLALLLSTGANAKDFDVQGFLNKTYITLGVAHKFQETKLIDKYGKLMRVRPTARIEVFYQYSKCLTFGISHHSQWFENWPINDRFEYSKTELFIDYTFSVGGLFK